MLSACNKIFECIVDYSNAAQDMNVFYDSPAFDKDIKEQAKLIQSSCFKKIGKSLKKVTYSDANCTYEIRLDDERCYKSCSCSCSTFIKWALCRHVVAYSNSSYLDLYGFRYRQAENFILKNKRGAPRKKVSKALSKD
jgi:hypothetical protein